MIDCGTTERGIDEMRDMPGVGVFAADAREIGPLRFEPHWNGWSYMLSAASE